MTKGDAGSAGVGAAGGGVRKPRARRWFRRAIAWSLGLAMLLFAALFALARSPLLKAVVEPRLGSALGADVRTGSMTLGLSGKLRIDELRVRAQGVAGPGGDILSTRRAVIDLDLSTLWGFAFRGAPLGVEGVRVEEPTLRVSLDRDTGVFNIQRLLEMASATSGASMPRTLPEVRVEDGTLVFGEHTLDRVAELASIKVSGRLHAPDPGRPQYAVRLDQTDAREGVKPMQVLGGVDLATASVWFDLNNLDLSRWRGGSAEWRARALWRQLSIEGRVARATLRAGPDIGYAAEMELRGVNLDAPIPAETDLEFGPVYPFMRLRAVDGTIRFDPAGFHADLAGSVEDLPGRMRLDTQGFSLDAPLRCEITTERTTVSDRPLILPFAPPEVRTLFRDFSGPTAEVTGRVVLTRGAPRDGVPDAIRAEGEVTFANGRCAFARFPYPGSQMMGTVRFKDNRVDIVKVTGVGPSGAKLFAEGWLLTGQGDPVEISVTVADVPVDRHLVEAMGERGPVVEEICSAEAFARLVAAGVVQSPGARAGAEADARAARDELLTLPDDAPAQRRSELVERIREAERRAATPAFEPGGLANVHVLVRRERGGEFQTIVEVDFPRLNVLARRFPLPLRADGAQVRIVDEDVSVRVARLAGLTGGEGSCEATLRLVADSAQVESLRGAADLTGVPIDPTLILALPDVGGSAGGPGVRDAIERLGVSGLLDARVEIGVDDVGYRASARLHDGAIAPSDFDGAPGERLVEGLAGPVEIAGDSWSVGPLEGSIGGGRVVVSAGGAAGAYELHAIVENADVARPLERIAGAIDEPRGRALGEMRSKHRPEGRFDAAVDVRSSAGEPATVGVRVERLRGVAFDAFGGRVGLDESTGAIVARPGGVSFDGFAGPLRFDGVASGLLRLHGSPSPSGLTPGLVLRLEGADVASPLVRTAVRERISEEAGRALSERQPRGEFDVEALVLQGADGAYSATGVVRPRWFSWLSEGRRVEVKEARGEAELRRAGGTVRDLTLVGDGWSARVDGGWTSDVATLSISGESDGLPADLMAALPEGVREAAREIDLRVARRASLRDGVLRLSGLSARGTEALGLTFAGAIHLDGASMDVGLGVTELVGDAWARVRRDAGSADGPEFEIEMRADRMRVAGAELTEATATIAGAPGDGVEVRGFGAALYGGRIVGRVQARFDDEDGAGVDPAVFVTVRTPRRGGTFEAAFEAAGVELATAFADLLDRPGPRDAGESGRMEFEVALAGESGRLGGFPERLEGRGRVRVRGGEIVSLPLALQAIELSNLQAPLGEAIEFAEAEFYVDGPVCVFDKLVARSGSVEIRGEGSASLPELGLDLRLRTSGLVRLPFISDVVDAVKNELLTIRVTGTLRRPEFGTMQMPATRGLVRDLLRPAETRRAVKPVASGGERADR